MRIDVHIVMYIALQKLMYYTFSKTFHPYFMFKIGFCKQL